MFLLSPVNVSNFLEPELRLPFLLLLWCLGGQAGQQRVLLALRLLLLLLCFLLLLTETISSIVRLKLCFESLARLSRSRAFFAADG